MYVFLYICIYILYMFAVYILYMFAVCVRVFVPQKWVKLAANAAIICMLDSRAFLFAADCSASLWRTHTHTPLPLPRPRLDLYSG